MKTLDVRKKEFLHDACRLVHPSKEELDRQYEEYLRTPKRSRRPMEDFDRYAELQKGK